MTQNAATVLYALAVMAAPFVAAAMAALAVWAVRKGPRYTVEAAGRTGRTATRYWTRRAAVRAARERTERTGVQFSAVAAPLI